MNEFIGCYMQNINISETVNVMNIPPTPRKQHPIIDK